MVGRNDNKNNKNPTPPPSIVASTKTKAFGIVAVVAFLGAIGVGCIFALNYRGLGAPRGGIRRGGNGRADALETRRRLEEATAIVAEAAVAGDIPSGGGIVHRNGGPSLKEEGGG